MSADVTFAVVIRQFIPSKVCYRRGKCLTSMKYLFILWKVICVEFDVIVMKKWFQLQLIKQTYQGMEDTPLHPVDKILSPALYEQRCFGYFYVLFMRTVICPIYAYCYMSYLCVLLYILCVLFTHVFLCKQVNGH